MPRRRRLRNPHSQWVVALPDQAMGYVSLEGWFRWRWLARYHLWRARQYEPGAVLLSTDEADRKEAHSPAAARRLQLRHRDQLRRAAAIPLTEPEEEET